jgi:hypothetical protein
LAYAGEGVRFGHFAGLTRSLGYARDCYRASACGQLPEPLLSGRWRGDNESAGLAAYWDRFVGNLGPLKPSAVTELEQKAQSGERMALAGGALWIDYGLNGAGKSKLTPLLLDKACGSPATGRNWNSVPKIGEMIDARS